MKNLSIRELTFCAALASLSAILQLIHLGYQSPQWGMWIDFVSVSWIMAFFLFGFRSALMVSFLGALTITFFAPETWLGASMKWLATLPVLLSLFFFLKMTKIQLSDYQKIRHLFLPLIVGIIIRCLIIIPINYYYAIPIWTGMTPLKAMSAIPWYIIASFNTIQTILDVLTAWSLVFLFRLNRYASWKE